MAEIIDILTHSINNAAFFTVDNTQPFVDVEYPEIPAVAHELQNANDAYEFQAGDNLTILSGGIALPEGFTWWKNKADIIYPNPTLSIIFIFILVFLFLFWFW